MKLKAGSLKFQTKLINLKPESSREKMKRTQINKIRNEKEEVTDFMKIPRISSVAQSCPTFFDPMDYSMPGFPVHHQLPKLALTQVHQVGDANQPLHPLSFLSPPAFNPSQHPGLFQ